MNSVCYLYRNRWKATFSDTLQLDDWEGSLDDVKSAGMALQNDADIFVAFATERHLSELLVAANKHTDAVRDVKEYLERSKLADEDRDYLKLLCLENPEGDRDRILHEKGGLMQGSYAWLLQSEEYVRWCREKESNILVLKGEPGKGKSMLVLGALKDLERRASGTDDQVTYFFFQATNTKLDSATAALKGFLWLLLMRTPGLIPNLRKDHPMTKSLENERDNAVYVLRKIAEDVFSEPGQGKIFVIIDALDECRPSQRGLLLDLMSSERIQASKRVKWLVSTRPGQGVQEKLDRKHIGYLLIGLDEKADEKDYACEIANAVQSYVPFRFEDISLTVWPEPRSKEDKEACESTLQALLEKSDETFLWVSLVIKELEEKEVSKFSIKNYIEELPEDLTSLYDRMVDQIDLQPKGDRELIDLILSAASVAFEPLTLTEMRHLSGLSKKGVTRDIDVEYLVKRCYCFLSVHGATVEFVHLSARDFVLKTERLKIAANSEEIHRKLFSASLNVMQEKLHRDMLDLRAPGTAIEDIPMSSWIQYGLDGTHYACKFLADHLSKAFRTLEKEHFCDFERFIEQKYLFWLEALSLSGHLSRAVPAMANLVSLLEDTKQSRLTALISDAVAFTRHHTPVISSYPLQAYASALLFSPRNSLIRSCFEQHEPRQFIVRPNLPHAWSPLLHTLRGHLQDINAIDFSHDSGRLASASKDGTIKVWDLHSGDCVATLEDGPKNEYRDPLTTLMAFAPNGQHLAAVEEHMHGKGVTGGDVKLWKIGQGSCSVLGSHDGKILALVFRDESSIGTVAKDGTVRVWSPAVEPHQVQCIPYIDPQAIRSACFSASLSPNLKQMACVIKEVVQVFDLNKGQWLPWQGRLKVYGCHALCLSDDLRIAIGGSVESTRVSTRDYKYSYYESDLKAVQVMYPSDSIATFTVPIQDVFFSDTGTKLALCGYSNAVEIMELRHHECLKLHGHSANMAKFSVDGRFVATVGSWHDGHTIKVWDLHVHSPTHTTKRLGHGKGIRRLLTARNRPVILGVTSLNESKVTITVWSTVNGECGCENTFDGPLRSVALSPDGTMIAVSFGKPDAYRDRISEAMRGRLTIMLYPLDTSRKQVQLVGHVSWVEELCFSNDSKTLGSAAGAQIKVWAIENANCVHAIEASEPFTCRLLAFSPDDKLLAAMDRDRINVWDAQSGEIRFNFSFETWRNGWVNRMAFSPDSKQLFAVFGTESLHGMLQIWDLARPSTETADAETAVDDKETRILRYFFKGFVPGPGENMWFRTPQRLYTGRGYVSPRLAPESRSGTGEQDCREFLKDLSSKGEINMPDDEYDWTKVEYGGLGLSHDDDWIQIDSVNHVWLPEDHRPFFGNPEILATPDMIAYGTRFGGIMIISLAER